MGTWWVAVASRQYLQCYTQGATGGQVPPSEAEASTNQHVVDEITLKEKKHRVYSLGDF